MIGGVILSAGAILVWSGVWAIWMVDYVALEYFRENWGASMWSRLILLILMDALGMNLLWGERFHRRVLHHLEKDTFNPSHDPVMRKLKQYIGLKGHIDELKRLDLAYADFCAGGANTKSRTMSKLSLSQYSPRATIYYDAMNEQTRALCDRIGEQFAIDLSAIVGERLHLAPDTSSFRAVILRYEGETAEFPWHYDTEHPSCYRALFLYHGEGVVAPLEYYTADREVAVYHLKEGDGWIFKGTKVLHRVPCTTDPFAKRYMIGFQFSPEPESIASHISLCSVLRQASVQIWVFHILPCLLICWLMVTLGVSMPEPHWKRIIGEHLYISRMTLFFGSVLVMLLSLFLPGAMSLRYRGGTEKPAVFWHRFLDVSGFSAKSAPTANCRPLVGTGLNKNPAFLARFLFFCAVVCLDIEAGFYFSGYLIATEMFMPNSLVGYV